MFKEINEKVYETLSGVTQSVFPVVAPVDTKFPFIIYRRTGDSYEDNKDAVYEHYSSFEVTVVSDSYEESLDMVEEVAGSLIAKDFRILNLSEYYGDGAYVQTLQIQNN